MTDARQAEQFWRDQSDEDFKTATSLADLGRNTYALFFCHLAIEKLLKALVVQATGANAPYDHNLQRLAQDAGLVLSDTMRDHLVEINTFNIKARYDDFKLQFYKKATREYTDHYIKETNHILLWLKQQ